MGTETIFDLALCFLAVSSGTGYILYKNKQKKQETDPVQIKLMRLELIFRAILFPLLIIGPIARIIIRAFDGDMRLTGIIVLLYFSLSILCIIPYTILKRRYDSSQKGKLRRVLHIVEYVFEFLLFVLFCCAGIISLIELL